VLFFYDIVPPMEVIVGVTHLNKALRLRRKSSMHRLEIRAVTAKFKECRIIKLRTIIGYANNATTIELT
jgi:hypothetical protein